MSLRAIVRALGGELYDGGRRANVPAPGHSSRDRSVSLFWTGERLLAHSFGGADWRAVLDDLRARGLLDPLGGSAAEPTRPLQRSVGSRIAAATALWEAGRPLAGTLAERHLRLRGIASPDSLALRHHPAVPAAVYARAGPERPALLTAITDPAGALSALEITYLDPNGRRAMRPRTSRKTVGVVPPGAAVRLGPPAAAMLVAEGVVTTLSAAARFRRPGWALLAAGNVAAWRAPAGVTDVLIAADRGRAGEGAAARLASRLRATGVTVAIALPPAPFGDWNEAAQQRVGEGGKGRV